MSTDQKPKITTDSLGGRVMRLPLATADGSATVTLRELTVAEIADWMERKINPDPGVDSWDLTAETMSLTDYVSLADLLLMSDLNRDAVNAVTPSVLTDIAEKAQVLNQAFFLMLEKIAGFNSLLNTDLPE